MLSAALLRIKKEGINKSYKKISRSTCSLNRQMLSVEARYHCVDFIHRHYSPTPVEARRNVKTHLFRARKVCIVSTMTISGQSRHMQLAVPSFITLSWAWWELERYPSSNVEGEHNLRALYKSSGAVEELSSFSTISRRAFKITGRAGCLYFLYKSRWGTDTTGAWYWGVPTLTTTVFGFVSCRPAYTFAFGKTSRIMFAAASRSWTPPSQLALY